MTTAKSPRRAPRATPKPESKPDEPSTVDQLAEDATPEEFEPGTPEFLVPLAVKPRGRRAEFKRLYADVIARYEDIVKYRAAVQAEEELPMSEQMRISAELDEVGQAIDDLLRFVAVDRAAYDAWSGEVSDDDLMKTFNIYQKRAQPGEASSSTS